MAIDPKYELLPESFEKKGRKYTLIARTDTATLYRVELLDTVRFETWQRRFTDGWTGTIKGKEVTFRPKEAFPPDAAFGSWAWCDITLEAARKRFTGIAGEPAPDPIQEPQELSFALFED